MPTANAKNSSTWTGDAAWGTPKMFAKQNFGGKCGGRTRPELNSRGYIKLADAAEAFNFDFRDKTVLDIGSSTGGFTKYALDHGAKKVIAIEKGTNQMMRPLRYDPRISLHEKTDIFDCVCGAVSEGLESTRFETVCEKESKGAGVAERFNDTISRHSAGPSSQNYNGHGRVAGTEIPGRDRLTRCDFDDCGPRTSRNSTLNLSSDSTGRTPAQDDREPSTLRNGASDTSVIVSPDVILADVSFISLTKILKHAKINLSRSNTEFLVMLKPQFEARPSELNKGVVKNERVRREIIKRFELWLKQNGFIIVKKRDNILKGKTGNQERFYLLGMSI